MARSLSLPRRLPLLRSLSLPRPLPMAPCLRAAVLCLLALLGAAPAAWGAPPRTEPGGWSVAPSGGGRPSFYAEGPPGAVLRDTVSVTNRGHAPVDVRLSGTGVRTAFADTDVRVPARTRAEVPFTVTVPAASEPGDRSGAIVARDAEGRTRTVRLRLRVGGPALAALTVEHVALHGDRITYELVNRGTTVLVPRLAIRADGVFGRVLDRAPRTLPVRLPPGTHRKLTEPWPDRPALDAVDIRLTVTAADGAHDTATASARFVPWGTVAGSAGAVAVGAGALLVVRRRGRRTTDGGPALGGPPPDTTRAGALAPEPSSTDAELTGGAVK